MSDFISRQDAIDVLVKRHDELAELRCYDLANGVGEGIEVVKALPSADRPKGKWCTNRFRYDCTCSNCGCSVYHKDALNFCPNCGAKMKGV